MFNYQAQITAVGSNVAATFLDQYNTIGATNNRILGQVSEGSSGTQLLFVNDGTAPSGYTYALVLQSPWTNGSAGFLSQLNQMGAQGYRYAGSVVGELDAQGYSRNYNIYRTTNGTSATYTYATDSTVSNSGAFLTQANGHGASGYFYLGSIGEILVDAVNIYEKDSAVNASYTYESLPIDSSQNASTSSGWAADFISQANAEGAKGYRILDTVIFDTQVRIYVRDSSQSATFAYESYLDSQKTIANLAQQANNHGSQGYWFFDWHLGGMFDSDAFIYVQPINCNSNNIRFCSAGTPKAF